MEMYLQLLIRQVDSSLLDEWERMKSGGTLSAATSAQQEMRPPGAEEAAKDITRDARAFTSAIRTKIFSFLRAVVNEEFEQALENLDLPEEGQGERWTAAALEQAFEKFYTDHQRICLDPNARNQRHTYVVPSEDKKSWRVEQVLVDPEGHNDWIARFQVDLARSKAKAEPCLVLTSVGPIG
jgi:hypothetical protein